jgi:hypothetical protein
VPQNILTLVDPDAHMPQLQHLRCVEAEPSCLPGFRELTQSAPNITSIWLGLYRKLTLPGVKSYFECLPHLEKLYLLTGPPDPWVPIVLKPQPYYVNPLRDWNRPMARGTRVVYDGPTRTVRIPPRTPGIHTLIFLSFSLSLSAGPGPARGCARRAQRPHAPHAPGEFHHVPRG